jgi:preprotein translocase subunit YajC
MTDSDNLILAQAAPATGTAGQTVPGSGSSISSTTEVPTTPSAVGQPAPQGQMDLQLLLPLGLLVLFYFTLIRPQNKKEKARQKQIKELTKNDKIITKGGIYGIVSVIRQEEGIASIKISENVKVDISLQAIEAVNPQKENAK